MKIIHCADLHLDSKMTSSLPLEKAKERRQEMMVTFRRMIDFAVQNQVEAIIIAGDLLDKKTASVSVRNTLLSMIQDHPQILFFYLRGNHDTGSWFSGYEEKLKNLYLFSTEHWISYPIRDTDICITGVEITAANNRRIFEELKLDDNQYNLLVLHGQTEECSYRNIRNPGGNTGVIPLRTLQNRGIDYLALGHIHKREAGKLDGRGVWCYPGCLEGRGFDECGDHGCIMIEIDPETHQTELTFVPLAGRMFHQVSVDISRCRNSNEIVSRIERKLEETNFSSRDLLKIVLVGETEITSDILVDYLNKQLEHLFYYVRVENRSQIIIDYGSYASDFSLKGEFVRQVVLDASLSEIEKTEIIQRGIRLLMGVDELED